MMGLSPSDNIFRMPTLIFTATPWASAMVIPKPQMWKQRLRGPRTLGGVVGWHRQSGLAKESAGLKAARSGPSQLCCPRLL